MLSTAWPALIAVRAPIEPALKQGGSRQEAGGASIGCAARWWLPEIAMSLTLLVACGLLLRTIYTLRHVPLGYRTDHIIVANLSIPSYRYVNKNVTQTLYAPLLERVQHLHGVQAAGTDERGAAGQTFNIMLALRHERQRDYCALKTVSPDIQRIFGFKMLAGRFFNDQDSPTSAGGRGGEPGICAAVAPNKHDLKSLLGLKVWNLRQDTPAYDRRRAGQRAAEVDRRAVAA